MKTTLVNACRVSCALLAGLGLSLALVATTGCGGPGEPDESVLDRVPKVKPAGGRQVMSTEVKDEK